MVQILRFNGLDACHHACIARVMVVMHEVIICSWFYHA